MGDAKGSLFRLMSAKRSREDDLGVAVFELPWLLPPFTEPVD